MATITNVVNNTIVSGTNEADSILNNASHVTIYGYGGDDAINDYTTDISRSVNNNVLIDAGEGNNNISSYSSDVTISTGSGNDSISTYRNNTTINAGDGDNLILSNSGSIISGNGNDTIYGTFVISEDIFINAGDGNNEIRSGSTSPSSSPDILGKATIMTGSGSDTINILQTYDSSIYSGAGDDYIFSSADTNLTINAGTGNDSVIFSSIISYTDNPTTLESKDFILYAEGDGDDTLQGYSVNDTIKIDSTVTPSTIASGTDIIINVGAGSIRLVNVTDTAVTAINSSGDLINFSEGNNTSIDTDSNVTPVTTETDTTSTVTPVTTETDTGIINVLNGKNYDIVFIIDVSNSMDEHIADVKNNVANFATSLKNSGVGNVRFGLISYETNAISQNFSEGCLTSDIEEFTTAVNNLSTYGSIEYGLTAIETAMSIVSDEDDTTKRFIVVTNEDYDDQTLFNATDVKNTLKSRGIVMDVVGSDDYYDYIEGYGYVSDYCRSEWEPLANATSGKFYLLDSGFPEIFKNIATDITNVVDLNLVPENQTGYFVATINSDTYTTPIFSTYSASGNDTTVGAVNEVNVYVADSGTSRQQTIIISDNWNATATKNDDNLIINGASATVTGGDGTDVFSLSSDTRTVTLMDLNIDEDKLSFGNYITPGTMRQSIEDNHLVLSADDLRVDIPAMSEMTDEFLNYSVSNAGNSATISELINGDGKAVISFAHWSFTFTPSSLEHFGF